MKRKRIYAGLFDFDGTIADTEKLHYIAFKKVLEKFALELTWEDYMKKYLAYTDSDFFKVVSKEFGLDLTEEDINSLCLEKSETFSNFLKSGKVEIYKGVKEFIEYFGSKYPLGIVSGALREEIEPVLEREAISKYFKFIVSAKDYSEGKPSPEPFEVALKKLTELGIGFEREGVVAFEDSLYGVLAAKKAGLLAVAVENFYKKEELISYGADITLESFDVKPEEIEKAILDKISKRIFSGERVILVPENRQNTFAFKVKKDSNLHTHLGVLKGADILGRYYGDSVRTNKGDVFFILEPNLYDRVMKLKRKSAIIYPKDSAFMIFLSGIGPGSRVIETGSGSGGLTVPLAHFVRPDGKVYVYEIRDDFIEILRENLKENNLENFVEIKKRDVYLDGFDERDVDAVFLDLPEPWHCVRYAWESLKPSGVLISVSPTVNQTEIMCEVMRREGFILVDTFEVLVRRFLAREGKSRPFEHMIAHTAYISLGRKVNKK